MNHKPLPDAIEIIKNKLYWISSKQEPANGNGIVVFNIDEKLSNIAVTADLGLVDISGVTRFVQELDNHLKHPMLKDKVLYHHTSTNDIHRLNAALMMAAFQVINMIKSPTAAWQPFSQIYPPLLSFRDLGISQGISQRCTVLDCLKGLEKAIKLGWYDVVTFDRKEYDHYAKGDHGNMAWVCPGKILAYNGSKIRSGSITELFSLEDHDDTLCQLQVYNVVRFNEKYSDSKASRRSKVKYTDMYFDETGDPSEETIENFILICENEKGPIGVYSKAGLGTAGLMIACYMMSKHKFTAAKAVGWIRLCSPGSIFANQYEFLLKNEDKLMGLDKGKILLKKFTTFGDEGVSEDVSVNGTVQGLVSPPKVSIVKGKPGPRGASPGTRFSFQ